MAIQKKSSNAGQTMMERLKKRDPIIVAVVTVAVAIGVLIIVVIANREEPAEVARVDFSSSEEVKIKSCVKSKTDKSINLALARETCEERIRNER